MKISVRFSPRFKKNKIGPFWIYCRLTVNGGRARSEMATGVSINALADWDKATKRVKGRSETTAQKNAALDRFYSDLMFLHNQEISKNRTPTADFLKALYTGQTKVTPTGVVAFYAWFLEKHKDNVKAETLESWYCRWRNLGRYVETKLGCNDVPIEAINAQWAKGLYNWYLEKGTMKNTAKRAVKSLKMVLNEALLEGLIESNTIGLLKLAGDPAREIVYLTVAEIEQLQNCQYYDQRLQKVVDCFVLQCFTGMSYNELVSFEAAQHLKTDHNGAAWIIISRGKTNEVCRIPLLPQARKVLEKYANKPPVITNQKMNDFLKEVAVIAQIDKHLTTHVGRKTAATYLLNKGVSMLVVSKILGHKSVKTTEAYYAHLQNDSIFEAVKDLM